MSKEDTIQIIGTVINVLPNALFKVKIENGNTIIPHISGKIRKNNITILLGDKVQLEMSAYDLNKARITFRYK